MKVKKIAILLYLLMLFGCSGDRQPSASINDNYVQQPLVESESSSKPLANAVNETPNWIPMVFTGFDANSLAILADNLKTGKVKRAAIIYPSKMKTLAQRIQRYLEDKTNQNIPMLNVELHNTEQVQYDLSQVIVTLYF